MPKRLSARISRRWRRATADDRGASVIETVIIAAGLAGLALATMATISALVDTKVAGISL